jgi:hypothetical protein
MLKGMKGISGLRLVAKRVSSHRKGVLEIAA